MIVCWQLSYNWGAYCTLWSRYQTFRVQALEIYIACTYKYRLVRPWTEMSSKSLYRCKLFDVTHKITTSSDYCLTLFCFAQRNADNGYGHMETIHLKVTYRGLLFFSHAHSRRVPTRGDTALEATSSRVMRREHNWCLESPVAIAAVGHLGTKEDGREILRERGFQGEKRLIWPHLPGIHADVRLLENYFAFIWAQPGEPGYEGVWKDAQSCTRYGGFGNP